jgi:hypothetical protein
LKDSFAEGAPPQLDGELRCCSRILVFECCFEYANDPSFS